MSTESPFLFSGNREEITQVSLIPVYGEIPEELHGYVYQMTQCGTVNSGGYPFHKKVNGKPNPEYGSPVLNGNGMIFLFDLSVPRAVTVSSRMVKAPSYYADEATRIGGPARKQEEFKDFHFNNTGIARMSFLLGNVNYANTALIPTKFPNDSGVSLLAAYDTGRPIKIDPVSLDFITPIGYIREWVLGMPPFLQAPFPMIDTTAHPSWDPAEQVLYSVNYTKSSETELSRTFLYELLRHDRANLEKDLEQIAWEFKAHQSTERAIAAIHEAINRRRGTTAPHPAKKSKPRGLLGWIWHWLLSLLEKFIKKETSTTDSVYLIRFDGQSELQRWRLVDEQGKDLVIYQCMHQTSLSKNYIVLMDSSFKFAFDLLINNPFPGNLLIDELIRILSSKTILPSTQIWIVDKRDLGQQQTVVARAVQGQPVSGFSNEPFGGVPSECVHFSTEYDDSNDRITIYTAQNNSTCLAEWIRPYDFNYFTRAPYDESYISSYAVGQLELSSIGKYVIDGKEAIFVPGASKIIEEKGILPPVGELPDGPLQGVGPNTWGIGLYSYRDMISPTDPGTTIEQLYFVNFGTKPELMTEFVYGLYVNQKVNRKIPLQDFMEYTRCGIPSSILSIGTASMEIEEHYEFEWTVYPVAIQFIPLAVPTPNRSPQKDGYIWVTLKELIKQDSKEMYQTQIWLFKGWEVATGPVCKLAAPDFNICAPLHINWMAEAQPVSSGYQVDVREDFEASIENSFLKFIERSTYQDFFEQYVYPHFPSR